MAWNVRLTCNLQHEHILKLLEEQFQGKFGFMIMELLTVHPDCFGHGPLSYQPQCTQGPEASQHVAGPEHECQTGQLWAESLAAWGDAGKGLS